MGRIIHIQPIQANFSGVSDAFQRGLNNLTGAFGTWGDALKEADARTSARNTGLLQQYITNNNPDDPNFQQGLDNLRKSFGMIGLPNEQQIAASIADQRTALQNREAQNLNMANTRQLMSHREALHPLQLEAQRLGLINTQQSIDQNALDYSNALDQQYGNRFFSDALIRATQGNLSDQELKQITELVPGFAPSIMKAYGQGQTLRAEQQKAFMEALGKLRGSSGKAQGGSNGSGDYSGVAPFIGKTFAGEDVQQPVTGGSSNAYPQFIKTGTQGTGSNTLGFNGSDTSALFGRSNSTQRGISKAQAHTGLRNAISASETAGGDYNTVNRGRRHKNAASNQFNVTEMTVGEVLQHQRRKDFNAAGHYQIIPDTLERAMKKLGIPPDAPFTPEMQDYIYTHSLAQEKRPQIMKYFNDEGSLDSAQQAAAMEWAGLASLDGKSYYKDGVNHAGVSKQQVRSALEADKARYKQYLAQGMNQQDAFDMAMLGYIPFSEQQPQQANIPPEVAIQNLQAGLTPIQEEVPTALINPAQIPSQNPIQNPVEAVNNLQASILSTNSEIAPGGASESDLEGSWFGRLLNQGSALAERAPEAINNLLQQAQQNRANSTPVNTPVNVDEIRTGNVAQEINDRLAQLQQQQQQTSEAKRGQDIPQQQEQFVPSEPLQNLKAQLENFTPQTPEQQVLWDQAADNLNRQYAEEMAAWQTNQGNKTEAGNLVNRDKAEEYLTRVGLQAQDFNSLPETQRAALTKELREYDRAEENLVKTELRNLNRASIPVESHKKHLDELRVSSDIHKMEGYDDTVADQVRGAFDLWLLSPEIIKDETGKRSFVNTAKDGEIKPIDLLSKEDVKNIFQEVFAANETYDSLHSGWKTEWGDLLPIYNYDGMPKNDIEELVKTLIKQKATNALNNIQYKLEDLKDKNTEQLSKQMDSFTFPKSKNK